MNSRKISLRALALLAALWSIPGNANGQNATGSQRQPLSFVDPFIGTAGTGHTFPGACVPFGMVQASPETGNIGWDYCSGYQFEDTSIIGFAQDHLNGTGSMDLGDILIFPFTGRDEGKYKSSFRKDTEHASPGYYTVRLDEADVDVEVTASAHTAFYRLRYGEGDKRLLVNLQSGDVVSEDRLRNHVLEASLEIPCSTSLRGSLKTQAFGERKVFFVIETDTPFSVESELPAQPGEKAKKLILKFDPSPSRLVEVRVALSTVSADGAMSSLEEESGGKTFGQVRKDAESKWNELLSRVDAQGQDSSLVMLYTSLYRAYTQPNNIADPDGRYRSADGKVHNSTDGTHYTIFSFWDTFRAVHPLYTILAPEMVSPMIQSMIDYEKI